ncbi:MAG: hypothetical protein R2911_08770 [Caldilineaceae bacterium]
MASALINVAVAQLPAAAYELPRESVPIPVSASASLDKETVEPGQPVDVAITWRLGQPLREDADLAVQWRNADGSIIVQEMLPLWPAFPTSQWPIDRFLRTVHRLRAPADAEPGKAEISLTLSSAPQSAVHLPITIAPSAPVYAAPIGATAECRMGRTNSPVGLARAIA